MTTPTVLRRALAALLVLTLAACYSYVPLESGRPRAGQDVEVHLKEDAGGEAAALRGDDGSVRGLVLRADSDRLTLSRSRKGARHTAVGATTLRDTVTIPTSGIERIDRSRIDVGRTALVAALGAGAVATAIILVINASPGGGTGGGGGGTGKFQQGLGIRIPLNIP